MKTETLQNLLARVMVIGVIIAAAVLVIGLAIYLPVYGDRPEGDKVFTGEPSYLRTLTPLLEHVVDAHEVGHRHAILQFGILLLLLNPLVRVAFAGIGFAIQRNTLYIVVSTIVFAALVFGFLS